jgi:hypothetical protein
MKTRARGGIRFGAIALAGAGLATAAMTAGLTGCASTPAPAAIVWTGGNAAHLAADKTACQTEADGVDINSATGYSDPRYGTTAAMAAAINRDAPLTDQAGAIKRAAFAACMSDKGWKVQ